MGSVPALPLRSRASRALASAILVGAMVPAFGMTVAQPWKVSGQSMEPNLHDGAVILVDGVGPRVGGYARGDIVIVPLPAGDPYPYRILVKRIVAVAGERVHIDGGRLYVDGRLLDEPYLPAGNLVAAAADLPLDVVVPPGAVFVMGDRRGNSYDSKAFGPVPVASLMGRAWIELGPQAISVMMPANAGPGSGR